MKKTILSLLSFSLLMFSSCSDDRMDEINKDNAHPSPETVKATFQITDAIMGTAYTTFSGDYSFYTSCYTEQLFGSGNNQLMKAELRDPVEVMASSCFNNPWSATYTNLLNISEIIRKVDEDIASSGNMLDLKGAAQVLYALNFAVLTELHGDIPFSEALKGAAILNPKLDSQSDIYPKLITVLDDAIKNLEEAKAKNMKNMGSQDIAFKGDVDSWIATAYAAKARLYLNMTHVDRANYAKAEEAAKSAINKGFMGFSVTEFNGVTCDNPWSAFIWSREYTAPSTSVTSIMTPMNDPRLSYYCPITKQEPKTMLKACTPGDKDMAKVNSSDLYPLYYGLGSQPAHIISDYELYFILAEAQVQQSDSVNAKKNMKEGVIASIDEIANLFEDDKIDSEKWFDEQFPGKVTLDQIMKQKYVALSYDGHISTYNDQRRYLAEGIIFAGMTNPQNTQGGMNRWPYLLPYGSDSTTSNPNVKEAYGDGYYIYSTKAWLFK